MRLVTPAFLRAFERLPPGNLFFIAPPRSTEGHRSITVTRVALERGLREYRPGDAWVPLSLEQSYRRRTIAAGTAAPTRVYFGTYTGGKDNPSEGIYTSMLDTGTGALSQPQLAAQALRFRFASCRTSIALFEQAQDLLGRLIGMLFVVLQLSVTEMLVFSHGSPGVWVRGSSRTPLGSA